ncbi:MAG: helix-turn-helix domain-containing protein [Lachnospiraceae bacterium]
MNSDFQKENEILPIDILVERIYFLLEKRKWTLKYLSDESNIPYETLKKITSKKIENPSMNTIYRISIALECSIDYLLGISSINYSDLSFLSSYSRNALTYLEKLYISSNHCTPKPTRDLIPLYIQSLSKEDKKSMPFSCVDLFDVSMYREQFKDALSGALRITGSIYHPLFFHNDILLIGNDRTPAYGEVAIFIHNSKLYIRRYLPGKKIVLEAINGIAQSIVLDSIHDWLIFGYLLGVHRDNNSICHKS